MRTEGKGGNKRGAAAKGSCVRAVRCAWRGVAWRGRGTDLRGKPLAILRSRTWPRRARRPPVAPRRPRGGTLAAPAAVALAAARGLRPRLRPRPRPRPRSPPIPTRLRSRTRARGRPRGPRRPERGRGGLRCRRRRPPRAPPPWRRAPRARRGQERPPPSPLGALPRLADAASARPSAAPPRPERAPSLTDQPSGAQRGASRGREGEGARMNEWWVGGWGEVE